MSRWYLDRTQPYLDAGEFPADPLADLNTQGNRLSVWHIEDDESNLDVVVTALATKMQNLSNVDYALIQGWVVRDLQIEVQSTEGGTPYIVANQWHRDLCDLSAGKLVSLAQTIQPNENCRRRIPQKKIRDLLCRAVESGRINPVDLQPGIREKVFPKT